ncbi:MAG TPA: hypothetical protein HA327_02805, partial [Candidatus Poseidoniaceae archaeon]
MELTAWQRFCNRILGRILKKRARRDTALSENLVKGSMGVMPEVYLSTVIFTSIAIALVCWGIIGIFFAPEVGVIAFWESLQDPATVNPCLDWEYWEPELVDKSKPGNGCPEYATRIFPPPFKFLILALLGAIIPYSGFLIVRGGAKREADRRGAQIEKYLPYAASYTAAMSAANATPAKIFRSLAMNKDIYGDVSE